MQQILKFEDSYKFLAAISDLNFIEKIDEFEYKYTNFFEKMVFENLKKKPFSK